MPSIFAISDTWFNRLLDDDPNANVVDNNEHIIQTWNETVGKDDEVYVLGGFGIGDLYQILVRLNGKIHFLNNYFNSDERKCMNNLKECLIKSSDPNIVNKAVFESDQIIILEKQDAILSYFPFADWSGKSSGTYNFHGLTETLDMENNIISCMAKKWNYTPVNLVEVQINLDAFKSRI